MSRLDYQASCRKLSAYLGDEVPPLPAALPRYDDRVLGVSFFKTRVVDDDFSNLTLPRTFFGRSEIRDVAFRNTDLRESNLCWNDFIAVDFSHALLTNSDLRSSIFEHVSFVRADLRGADLRRTDFVECTFSDARLDGARLTREQAEDLTLSNNSRPSSGVNQERSLPVVEPLTMVVMLLGAAPAFDPTAELTKGKLAETISLSGVTFDEATCAKVSGVGRVTGAERAVLKRCILQALGSTRWRSGGSGPTKTSRLFEVNGFAWELRFEHDDRGPHGKTTPRDERLISITRWNIAQARATLFSQLQRVELLGDGEALPDGGVTNAVTLSFCVNSDGTVRSCGVSGRGSTSPEAVSAVERECPRSLKPATFDGEPLSVCVDAVVRLRDP